MSLLSDFVASGGKPRLITRLTSGTGTHVPTADMARCLVRIQGGGAGGGPSASTSGGGGGAMVEVVVRIPIAGWAYAVGAAGAAGAAGSPSSLGIYIANGGMQGASGPYPGRGGLLGLIAGAVSATNAAVSASSPMYGVAGGCGGYFSGGGGGGLAGNPCPNNDTNMTPYNLLGAAGTNGLVGGGGDSFFGRGGANNASPAAGNYGAGGGGGAAGAGGLIEIWDFGV